MRTFLTNRNCTLVYLGVGDENKNYWHRVSKNTASPTNLGGAQALGKKFPSRAPRIIHGKNPPLQWPPKIVCPQGDLILNLGEHTPPNPRPLPLEPTLGLMKGKKLMKKSHVVINDLSL